MNIVEIYKDSLLYEKALELRYQLFFKEHYLPRKIVKDKKEQKSIHVAVSNIDELIGYGRLTLINKGKYQISQMVVSPRYQNQGYGTKLLIELMKMSKKMGAETIFLNARTNATNLYSKQGFVPVGKIYASRSTGIPHIKMVHYANT